MSNKNERHNKKEEQKKLVVRVMCIALAVLLSLSAFVGVLGFFA